MEFIAYLVLVSNKELIVLVSYAEVCINWIYNSYNRH